MDISILTTRGKKARARINAAAQELTRGYDLFAQANALHEAHAKDPAADAVLFLEATADFLERVVSVTIEPPTADVTIEPPTADVTARPKPPTRARAATGEE